MFRLTYTTADGKEITRWLHSFDEAQALSQEINAREYMIKQMPTTPDHLPHLENYPPPDLDLL